MFCHVEPEQVRIAVFASLQDILELFVREFCVSAAVLALCFGSCIIHLLLSLTSLPDTWTCC